MKLKKKTIENRENFFRGTQNLETICLQFSYKIKYPENFFLLRGNHECAEINRTYGYYDECKRRYSVRLWHIFQVSYSLYLSILVYYSLFSFLICQRQKTFEQLTATKCGV